MKRVILFLLNIFLLVGIAVLVQPKPQSVEAAIATCSSAGGTCKTNSCSSQGLCALLGTCTGTDSCCRTCPTKTPTKTPTKVPTKIPTKVPVCKTGSECKDDSCDAFAGWCTGDGTCKGWCCKLCPTPTPTLPPCLHPNVCKEWPCYDYQNMADVNAECTLNPSYHCCKIIPTSTSVPTKTPTPTPTTACGAHTEKCCSTSPVCDENSTSTTGDYLYCSGGQCLYAYGGDVIHCDVPAPTPGYLETCTAYKAGTTDYVAANCLNDASWVFARNCPEGYVCANDKTNCVEATFLGQYCLQSCNDAGCVSETYKKDKTHCWDNYTDYLLDQAGELGPTPGYSTNYDASACLNITNCIDEACVARWDTCGGTLTQTRCDELYPGLGYVPHLDSCGGQDCGPACNPTPIGNVGDCIPDCANPENYCYGDTFPPANGCGVCYGTGICSGTISARAVRVTTADTSCSALTASTTDVTNTVFSFSPALVPATQTQTGGTPVTWTGVTTTGSTNYRVTAAPQNALTQANVCVSSNGGAYIQSASAALLKDGTLDFIIGYLPQAGWVQTVGGNVYASNALRSSIPLSATNPYFSLAGAMGSVGMVSYGSTYDFSLETTNLGETMVSTTNWLVQHTNSFVDYYTQFATRMDVPDAATTLSTVTEVAKPTCASSPCIFYANGDMTTSTTTSWSIPANEQIILFVNGNVTINRPITIADGGFFAIVAHGNITVSSAVGTTVGVATPTVEGIYIATNENHSAMFATSASQAGTERLVIQGSVIADDFQLLRDLDTTNTTTPAEQFVFDPQLLFTMPDTMKEIPYVWQEVAP